MHYRTTVTVDEIAECLGVATSATTEPFYVLDIGSGFGESARYLAQTFPNVYIDCVEINGKLHRQAQQLTRSLPLQVQKRIRHIQCDIVPYLQATTSRTRKSSTHKHPHPQQKYNGIMCLMTLLHLSVRNCYKVLSRCTHWLQPLGRLVTEDFFCTKPTSKHVSTELCQLFGITDSATRRRTFPQFVHTVQRVRALQCLHYDNLTPQSTTFVQERLKMAEKHYPELYPMFKRIRKLFDTKSLDVRRGVFQLDPVLSLPVPRQLFVHPSSASESTLDRPLSILHGQTISAPHIHQMTLGSVQGVLRRVKTGREPHIHFLDVGCGSGYVVAMLCDVLDTWLRKLKTLPRSVIVVGVDVVPELVTFATRNVERWLDQRSRKLHPAIRWMCVERDGWLGDAEHQPYTFINVGAMADTFPRTLQKQLSPNGRMLVPVSGDYVQYDQHNGHQTTHILTQVRFVPMVHTLQNA